MAPVDDYRQVTRRAALFVTALWGQRLDVITDDNLTTPKLDGHTLYIPAFDLAQTRTARASALHAYAHTCFGHQLAFNPEQLKTRQIRLIELIEDARVEACLFQQWPGLRRLFIEEVESESATGNAFDRLTYELLLALMQPDVEPENPWVRKGVALFYAAEDRWLDAQLSIELGLKLAHEIGQMRISMNEKDISQRVSYRDDNQHLWAKVQGLSSGDEACDEPVASESQPFLVEADQGRQLALAHSKQAGDQVTLYISCNENPALSYRTPKANESESESFYPEWHYKLDRYRQNWCSIDRVVLPQADASDIEQCLNERVFVLRQLQRIARNLRLERMQRQRRIKDGDELDLNLAIDAYVDVRRGENISERIYEKSRPVHDSGLATQLLLDISASTSRKINPQVTLLDVALQAAMMLTRVIDNLYESVAIEGFCSNTRNQIAMHTIKAFHETDLDKVMRRMASLESHWSTRLGAAIRSAIANLSARDEYHKLLLVVSDGEPSDIDVFDTQYLVEDARMAVQEAQRKGLMVFCALLNPAAEKSARRIFGLQQVLQVSDVSHLPENIARMFLKIIRHY